MVGVEVAEADRVEFAESPMEPAHLDLRPLAAIEEDEAVADPDLQAGEWSIRQRHHGPIAEQQGIDH